VIALTPRACSPCTTRFALRRKSRAPSITRTVMTSCTVISSPRTSCCRTVTRSWPTSASARHSPRRRCTRKGDAHPRRRDAPVHAGRLELPRDRRRIVHGEGDVSRCRLFTPGARGQRPASTARSRPRSRPGSVVACHRPTGSHHVEDGQSGLLGKADVGDAHGSGVREVRLGCEGTVQRRLLRRASEEPMLAARSSAVPYFDDPN